MSFTNNILQTGPQSLTKYLVDLVEHPVQQGEGQLLTELQFLGIKSFLVQSTHANTIDSSSLEEEILLLGIAGRISKTAIPLISSRIHQQLTDLGKAHTHLAVVLDSNSMSEFTFYKFLTDLIVNNQIQSLTIFSRTFNRSIELGIEFIQNFTSKSQINYVVNPSLPIEMILDAHSLASQASTI